MENFNSHESLRKNLDPNIRNHIDDIVRANPDISPEELSEIFGTEAIDAYYSNPNAGDFDYAA